MDQEAKPEEEQRIISDPNNLYGSAIAVKYVVGQYISRAG
jgi:hypothetical protein